VPATGPGIAYRGEFSAAEIGIAAMRRSSFVLGEFRQRNDGKVLCGGVMFQTRNDVAVRVKIQHFDVGFSYETAVEMNPRLRLQINGATSACRARLPPSVSAERF